MKPSSSILLFSPSWTQAAWGRGFATEGAKACLAYGFSDLKFKEVYSFTATINEPSQNVMRKIGMQFVDYFDHPRLEPGSPLRKHVLYCIQRDSAASRETDA
ncbi:GNAT family N-acetyltransferase [Paenibacillus senegalensis]|uniref:GNAT family N-acetyltransferase n=1 Tax=Paenibacillus senegalensis TaxID=1465766 RepID=UPI0021CBC6F3|nr:GNAT family N-acetyltransferase [Paenibacillus senegalensis]